MKIFKGIICLCLSFAMCFAFVGCGKKDDGKDMVSNGSESANKPVEYKDGEYEAADGKYDDQGYRDVVKVVIKDGKLYSVDCDADSKAGGTKKDHSESGQYNMKTGGAQYDWHEEIAFFEKHVVNKGVESVQLKNDGKTDTVSGCTIAVKNYVKLIKEAMDKAKK